MVNYFDTFDSASQVRGAVVSDHTHPTGTLANVSLPKHGTYWGLASVNSLNTHPHEGA